MRETIILLVIFVGLLAIVVNGKRQKEAECKNYGGVMIGGGAYSEPSCVHPDGSIVMEYYK